MKKYAEEKTDLTEHNRGKKKQLDWPHLDKHWICEEYERKEK
jgi:hypothetical protein